MQRWRSLVESCKYQIFISRSVDPYLNLSIEHYLLQKSPPHSTVLFLYVNRPCVVIGRNQNPWLEIDLKSLRQRPLANNSKGKEEDEEISPDDVQLVRRRSGGGTVFHDFGNVNYSVICPTPDFSRDRHAEMVTKALRAFNPRARVNERHDIVLDQGPLLDAKERPDSDDMHRTAFHPSDGKIPPLKVSGSAYKLTRLRSLHHGTCLVASKNLPRISQLLNSPARSFIKARGVESVRSPIGNISDQTQDLKPINTAQCQDEVIRAFGEFHKIDSRAWSVFPEDKEGLRSGSENEWVTGCVDHDQENIDQIRDGVKELKVSSNYRERRFIANIHEQSLAVGFMDKLLNSYCPVTA